jgi:hypothetical protein
VDDAYAAAGLKGSDFEINDIIGMISALLILEA